MAKTGVLNIIRSVRSRFLTGMFIMITPLAALVVVSYFSLISSLQSLDDAVDPLFHNLYTLRELQYQLRRLPEFSGKVEKTNLAVLKVPIDNISRDISLLFGELLDSPLVQHQNSTILNRAHQEWQQLQGRLLLPAQPKQEMVRKSTQSILRNITQFQSAVHDNFRSDFFYALQGRKDISLLTAALSFFGLLLAITAALLLYANIFEPLRKLRQGAEHIMTGDLNHRIESSDTGDVGRLADSFNCLAGMLKSNQSSIRMHTAHDSLTGLYNKKEFKVRFDTELQRAKRYSRPFALMMVDIDHLSSINEKHGHVTGDETLRVVAVNLSREVRPVDTVARLENDDFIVIMPDIGVDDALATGKRLRNHFKDQDLAINTGSKPIPLTVSIGISLYPDDGEDFEEVFARVNMALKHAKNQGNQVAVYSPDENSTETGETTG